MQLGYRPGLWKQDRVAAPLLGMAAFLVYFRTLAPSIVAGDGAELTAAAWTGGVAHPTGYPLYTLLGFLFTHALPVGSVAWRMNLLSALCAGAAVGITYLLARAVVRSRISAAAATLLFAFSRTFWSQSVSAEVYALHVLGVAAVFLAALRWQESGETRWLRGTALLYGLCLAHHAGSVLLAPALLVLGVRPRRGLALGQVAGAVPFFLAPLLLYLYLPHAAARQPAVNWGDPGNWHNFWFHVTGREFQSQASGLTPTLLWHRVLDYAGPARVITGETLSGYLQHQCPLPLLAFAAPGLYTLFRSRPRTAAATVALYLAVVVHALSYRIGDIEVYYLPSHLMVALWIGCGVRQLLTVTRRRVGRMSPPRAAALWRRVAPGMALLLPLPLLAGNWQANDRHADWTELRRAREVLDHLKPDALLVGTGDWSYLPLLYVRYVENRRADVLLLSATDLVRPERLRVVTRLEAYGLEVNVPECYRRGREGIHLDGCLLRRILRDNPDRPLYAGLTRDRGDLLPWVRTALAGYEPRRRGHLGVQRMLPAGHGQRSLASETQSPPRRLSPDPGLSPGGAG